MNPGADDPLVVLEQTIAAESARLEQRRIELAEAGEALIRLRSLVQHEAGGDGGAEPVADSMVVAMVEHLYRHTTGPVLASTFTITEGPGIDEANVRFGLEEVRSGRVQRTLYAVPVLEHDAGRRWVDMWGEAGEEQRVTTAHLSEFAVFGDTVLASAAWADPASSYVIVRQPMLVAAFTTLHEVAWASGAAVPRGPARGGDDRLLSYLALGIKDEAIARHLGWGLRTVRRRVAGLMADYGVDTRFQLGAAAARSGRLDDGTPR